MTFPDIDYAFFGYDILKGFPMAMGSDPGFTYPIFHADYSRKSHTADCRYSVPRGLVVTPDVSCDVSFTSSVVKTTRAYESQLSVSAHVSGGGWGVQFSASAGYRQARSEISTGEYVYIVSSAKCNYYTSRIQQFEHPVFDETFLTWVRKLEKSNDDDDYLAFFQKYGTHFPSKVTFGARFMHEHRMKTTSFETMESSGVNVAVAASYSGLFSVGGGFNLDSSQRQQASDFSKEVRTKVITVGAAPPSNADAMTWASNVQQNPVPTSYELEPTENLFTESYMKEQGIDYQTLHENIKSRKVLYWQSVQRQTSFTNIEFDLGKSILVPNWFVNGTYEEEDVSFNDCFRICSNLKKECFGLSYCHSCMQNKKSKCSIFGQRARSRNWFFNEQWQTIIVNNEINLNGMVVSEISTTPLDIIVMNIEGSKGSQHIGKIQRECREKFDEKSSKNSPGDKAVAYTYGYIFNGSFAICKIYGSRQIFILEERRSFNTVVKIPE